MRDLALRPDLPIELIRKRSVTLSCLIRPCRTEHTHAHRTLCKHSTEISVHQFLSDQMEPILNAHLVTCVTCQRRKEGERIKKSFSASIEIAIIQDFIGFAEILETNIWWRMEADVYTKAVMLTSAI